MDSLTTYNLRSPDTGLTNIRTDVSNKLMLLTESVDTGEVVDLEAMLSYMKLEYDFDITSVLVKAVALKPGYSVSQKDSTIREVLSEYAELFNSLCKDSDNSWLKLKFYVIRLKLDTLLVERLLRDYLKRCKLHTGLLSKVGKSSKLNYYVKQSRLLLEEIGYFGRKRAKVLKHIEIAIDRYRLKSECEFHALEKEFYRLRERGDFKLLTDNLENCKIELNERLSALGVGLFISSANRELPVGSVFSKAEGDFTLNSGIYFSIHKFDESAVVRKGIKKFCTTSSESDVESEELADLDQGLTDSIQSLAELTDSLANKKLSFEDHMKNAKCTCRILTSQNLPDLEWVIQDASKSRARENNGVDPAGQQVESVLEKIAITQAQLTLVTEEKRELPSNVLESEARTTELKSLLETHITPTVYDTLAAYRELRAITAEMDDQSDSSGTGGSPMEIEESGTDPDCGEE